MTDNIKPNNIYLKQIELLAKHPNSHFIVEGQGENATIKKAGLITTAIETFRGWIGLGNRTSKDIIEYQLIQIIGNGTAKGLITLTNLASILKAAKAAGLTSILDEKTGKHAELTSTIQSIVTGKFDPKTYATNAERFYSSHKSLSKIAAKPIIPQIPEHQVIKSPVEQPPEPKKSPTPAAQATIGIATAMLNETPPLTPPPIPPPTSEPLLDNHEVTDLTSITYTAQPEPKTDVEEPVKPKEEQIKDEQIKEEEKRTISDNPARKKKEKNASIAVKTGLLATAAFVIFNFLLARFSPTTTVLPTQTLPQETFNRNVTGIYDFGQNNFIPVANFVNFNSNLPPPTIPPESSAMVAVENVSSQVSKSWSDDSNFTKVSSPQDIRLASENATYVNFNSNPPSPTIPPESSAMVAVENVSNQVSKSWNDVFNREEKNHSSDLEEEEEFEPVQNQEIENEVKHAVKNEVEPSVKTYEYKELDLNLKGLDLSDPTNVPMASKDDPLLLHVLYNQDSGKHLSRKTLLRRDYLLKQYVNEVFENNNIKNGNEPFVWSPAVENRFKKYLNSLPQLYITEEPGFFGRLVGQNSRQIENPQIPSLVDDAKKIIAVFNFVLDQNIKKTNPYGVTVRAKGEPENNTIANFRSIHLDEFLYNKYKYVINFLVQEEMLIDDEFERTIPKWKSGVDTKFYMLILGGNKREE